MSATIVQDAILNILRNRVALDAEFSNTLSGLLTSSGINVTGDQDAKFQSDLKVGDYIGDIAHEYRRIKTITGDQALTIESAFISEYAGETVKRSDINKGMPTEINLTQIGKALRVVLVMTADVNENAAGELITVGYGFHFVVGFYEPDIEKTDERISEYDVLIRNSVDADPTFGSICLGNTSMDTFEVTESFDAEGVYMGMLPMLCYKLETRGSR